MKTSFPTKTQIIAIPQTRVSPFFPDPFVFCERFQVLLAQMPLRRTQAHEVLTRCQDVKIVSAKYPGVNRASASAFLCPLYGDRVPALQNAPDSRGGGCVCVKQTGENWGSPCSGITRSRSCKLLQPERTQQRVLPGLATEAQSCDVIYSRTGGGRWLSQVWREPGCHESVPGLSHHGIPCGFLPQTP